MDRSLGGMMKHDWKLGWKEHKLRGYIVDECQRCGVLRLLGVSTFYIKPEEATRFKTTDKLVHFSKYIPCEGE